MPRKAMLGMTDTAYGRSRGTTGVAIRKHRSSGLLKPAILPDGSIDPVAADKLLSEGLPKGSSPPPDLTQARRRKTAAQVALLQDELDTLLEQLVRPEAAAEVMEAMSVEIVTVLRRLLDAAAQCAWLKVNMAAGAMEAAVINVLTDLSKPPRKRRPEKAARPEPETCLSDLTAIELAARKADLEARLLEVQRDEAQGVVVRVCQLTQAYGTRLANLRSGLLALPTRVAPQLVYAAPAEAMELVRTILVQLLDDLAADAAQARKLKEIINAG